MARRFLFIGTLAALSGAVLAAWNPVNNGLLKVSFLASAAAFVLGILVLVWKRAPLRIAVLIAFGLVAVPLVFPGRPIDVAELRGVYVRRMSALEGTTYIWGGESARGIDCSGLPRKAYREALLSCGIKRGNGGAVRSFVEQWWFDASAKALGNGYRGYTWPLGITGTIREMDYGGLIPGDLAVTSNGVHIMAYAGQGRWIQADPGIGSVATLDGRKDKNVWFEVPVTTHRWRLLAPGN